MSIEQTRRIWEAAPVSGSKLIVLLAMADFADDKGRGICQSMSAFAKKARLSVTQTRRVIHELITDGLVEVVEGGGWDGKNNRSGEYRIVQGTRADESTVLAPARVPPSRQRQDGTRADGSTPPRADGSTVLAPTRVPPSHRREYPPLTDASTPLAPMGGGDGEPTGVSKDDALDPTSHTRAHSGWLVDQPIPNGDGSTNQPNQCAHEPDREVAHALATSLLLACKMALPQAKECASKIPFLEIRRQVCAWYPSARTATNPPGLLYTRLRKLDPVGDLTPEFKRSRLYLDYLTPAEKAEIAAIEAQAEAAIEAARTRVLEPVSRPEPEEEGPLGVVWYRAKMEVLAALPPDSPAREWLQASRLEHTGAADGEGGAEVPLYTIRVDDPAGVTWLNNRAAMLLRRTLGTMLGSRIMVVVACEEG